MYGIKSEVATRSYTSSVPSWGLSKSGNQSSYSIFTSRTGTNSGLKIKNRKVYKQFFVTRRRRGIIGSRTTVYYEKYLHATRTKNHFKNGVLIKTTTKNIYRRRPRTMSYPVKGWIYYRVPKWIMIPGVGATLFVPPNRLSFEVRKIRNDNASTSPITFNNAPSGQTRMNGIMSGLTATNMQFGLDVDALLNESYPPGYYQNLDRLTTVKLHEKFRSGIASLTTMAAESQKTGSMLVDYSTRILSSLVGAKKQFSKEVARFGSREGVASEYLKVIYGLLPFVKDVQSLKFQLSQETKVWRTYRAVESIAWKTSGGIDVNGNSVRYTIDHKLIVKKQASIDGSQPFSSFRPPGIGTMLDTAWEVVPWSFVIDWFVPLGSYLASLDILSNVQVKSYHVSTMYLKTLKVESYHHRSPPNNWRIGPGDAQVAYATKITFVRTIPQSIPAFPLSFTGKGLTTQRSLNAFFLALQQLGRK